MKQITGIMGAMPEEVESIHAHMENTQEHHHGNRKYYTGKIQGHEVVLVFSRWGKVAAAATVTSLITEFNIDQLIFTGVAGATASDLNIGDIVISDRLYQHDMDPRPLFKKHQIPLTDIIFFEADSALKARAYETAKALLSNPSHQFSESVLKKFEMVQPKCCFGLIATGDQFIYSEARTKEILEDMPEASAVEMEGAAVAQVCWDYQIPFVVIRTISDKADHASAVDFPAFIRDVARHYSEALVLGMLQG